MPTDKAISLLQLKEVIRQLNVCGILEKVSIKPIIIVDNDKDYLVRQVVKAVHQVIDNQLDPQLPDDVVDFYNFLWEIDVLPFPTVVKKEEKKPYIPFGKGRTRKSVDFSKRKKINITEYKKRQGKLKVYRPRTYTPEQQEVINQKLKKARAVRRNKPKTRYGHTPGTKRGKMDDLFHEGKTYHEVMALLNIDRCYVVTHVTSLKKKGLTVLERVDYDCWGNIHIRVKEESL